MNKVSFRTVATASSWLQRSRVVRTACGSRSHHPGTISLNLLDYRDVSIFRVFAGWTLELSLFGHTFPQGFCGSKCTKLSQAVSLTTRGLFLPGVSEIVHPLKSLRDKYMPFN